VTEDEVRAIARALIPVNAAPLSLSELENYLLAAADQLRGAIDQADFKAYIFPLMFFKRISDVYLEEYGEALADSGGDNEFASFAENHRFTIPEGCLWEDVRVRTENVGTALQSAFREIEKANPETLYGIFGNANWTNKDKLPDRRLSDLIEHFSSKALTNAAVPPDVFGNAYEYLIKKFADQSNKKAGEYYNPTLRGRPARQHPRPARGRDRLRPCLRNRRHADRGHPTRQGARREPEDPAQVTSSRKTRDWLGMSEHDAD